MIVSVVLMINLSSVQSNGNTLREIPLLGIKIGTNISNVYDAKNEDFDADSKFGLAAGLFLAIPIGKYMGIQPEILFSQKGFQATGRLLGISYELTRTTNYIDVPLLFALKPTGFLTVLAGPQYSFLLKQKDSFKSDISTVDVEKEFNNENIRKNTLCFLGGLDLNLDHLVIGIRTGWDILTNNGDGTSVTPRYKNVWYQFTVGYRFYY